MDPVARALGPLAGREVWDLVLLAHDERVLRRRRLETVHGDGFLVDLARTQRVEAGDAFALEDGRLVAAMAAEEPLIEVLADDLARIAWHVGNRHAACQVEPGRLLVARDHVMRAMLEGLGARCRDVSEPFWPEGGAYSHDHAGLGSLSGG